MIKMKAILYLALFSLVIANITPNLKIINKSTFDGITQYEENQKIGSSSSEERVEVKYVGAVLEYEPFREWSDSTQGLGIMRENTRILLEYTAEAKKQGADIIVYPEYGLQGLGTFDDDIEKLFTFSQYIPDPNLGIIPCKIPVEDRNEIIVTLSCAAIEIGIYIVVDLTEPFPCNDQTRAKAPWPCGGQMDTKCPESGIIFYNSQFVLDRKGTVIARYRKRNLFLEPAYTPGTEDDRTAIFTTDFDVTFGLQICFDIWYEKPSYSNVIKYGIRDMLMSTAWFDELPFLVGSEVQNGWSRGLGVNLLVSGYHSIRNTGSGIYRGYSDFESFYIRDLNTSNVMIVASVSTLAGSTLPIPQEQESVDNLPLPQPSSNIDNSIQLPEISPAELPLIFHDDLSNHSRVYLPPGDNLKTTLCHNDGLCCHLKYSHSSRLNYMLLAFSGITVKGFALYKVYIQVCAVVWCRSKDVATCAMIEGGLPQSDTFGPYTITGNFQAEQVSNVGMTRSLQLIENNRYSFTREDSTYTISTDEPLEDIICTGMYSRWYSRDL